MARICAFGFVINLPPDVLKLIKQVLVLLMLKPQLIQALVVMLHH